MSRVNFRVGKYSLPVEVTYDAKYYYLGFGFSKPLLAEVKAMQGAKWLGYDNPPRKCWRIDRCDRNEFQLSYLRGNNPYARFEQPLVEMPKTRFELLPHQIDGVRAILTVREHILAYEMGTGKSLIAIAAAEILGITNWCWVAPKSALNAVKLEMVKWGVKHWPTFYTYEGITKAHKENREVFLFPPEMLIIDESQRIKQPTTQRSQAVAALASIVRSKHKSKSYIVELTGTPAPRNPADLWHQCEVACPGFLREGSLKAAVNRLAWVSLEDGPAGQKYPKLQGWKDDPNKCDVCGKIHDTQPLDGHAFKPSKNEIAFLYERTRGLLSVKFKKDCNLNLPEKIYDEIQLEITKDIQRKAEMIQRTGRRAIEVLTKLRELSDGFQYVVTGTGEFIQCEFCFGTGKPNEMIMPGAETCLSCEGKGKVERIDRSVIRINTPKIEALTNEADYYSDVGRLVVYAGFTESIDLCVETLVKAGWDFIRVDGRGWHTSLNINDQLAMLREFQAPVDSPFRVAGPEKLAFIGHAGSAGTGLTLTASPAIVYFSNDFNSENRRQSEDRIHRIGSKGARIVDLIHLKTDKLVLENLRKKKQLEALALGEIQQCLSQ